MARFTSYLVNAILLSLLMSGCEWGLNNSRGGNSMGYGGDRSGRIAAENYQGYAPTSENEEGGDKSAPSHDEKDLTADATRYPNYKDLEVKDTFKLNDFTAIVADPAHQEIEALLAELPEWFRKRQILLYQSASLQKASAEAPRVILFNHDASFILAMGSHQDDPKRDVLEMASFNVSAQKYEFRSYSKGILSEPNPASCMSCHRAEPKPNWNGYAVWPGVYGGLERHTLKDSQEAAMFTSYLKVREDHPRYKHLPAPAVAEGSYEGLPTLQFVDEMTIRFSLSVSRLNFIALASRLSKHPAYAKFKYALVATAGGCAQSLKDVLGTQRAAALQRSEQAYAEKVAGAHRDYVSAILQAGQAMNLAAFAPEHLKQNMFLDTANTALFAVLVEDLLGLDLSGWSLSSIGRNYVFATPAAGLVDLAYLLTQQDEDLKFAGSIIDIDHASTCEALNKQSRAMME